MVQKIKPPSLGRTKCLLIADCGRQITTVVYVVAGETQSLLGLGDAQALGIIQITPERQLLVRELTKVNQAHADTEAIM